MKKKLIIGICTAVVISLFTTVYLYNVRLNSVGSEIKSTDIGSSVKANFSEIRLSQDDLIKNSDIIVRCVFKGDKETKDRTRMTTGGDGKENSITIPVTTYKMKLVENIKGTVGKNFDVVTAGGGNEYLESGDEYILFLTDNKSQGTYTLVSYSQGLNIVKQKESNSEKNKKDSATLNQTDSTDEVIESAETKEVVRISDLKKKIKELEK